MGHHLRAYIFRKDDIKSIELSDIPHAEHAGFIIMPMGDRFFSALDNPPLITNALVEKFGSFVEIETDYFGGGGEQTADLYINKEHIFISDVDRPINAALAQLGVVKNGLVDEFDTISLGMYRDIDDIMEAWRLKNLQPNAKKDGLEIERRFLLKCIPSVISDRIFNGYRGKKIGQTYIEMPDGTEARIRRVYDISNKSYSFVKTVKTPVSPGINHEVEDPITEAEYTEMLAHARRSITKTRYEFMDDRSNLLWEIDDFGSMVIAEVELPDIRYDIQMPKFIEDVLVLEVTGMDSFNNYNLAKKI